KNKARLAPRLVSLFCNPSIYRARNIGLALRGQVMSKAERQTPFSRECDVFLTSAIGNAGAGASAHGATNQSSFATTRKRANERTRASAAADHSQVTFVVIFALQ